MLTKDLHVYCVIVALLKTGTIFSSRARLSSDAGRLWRYIGHQVHLFYPGLFMLRMLFWALVSWRYLLLLHGTFGRFVMRLFSNLSNLTSEDGRLKPWQIFPCIDTVSRTLWSNHFYCGLGIILIPPPFEHLFSFHLSMYYLFAFLPP